MLLSPNVDAHGVLQVSTACIAGLLRLEDGITKVLDVRRKAPGLDLGVYRRCLSGILSILFFETAVETKIIFGRTNES